MDAIFSFANNPFKEDETFSSDFADSPLSPGTLEKSRTKRMKLQESIESWKNLTLFTLRHLLRKVPVLQLGPIVIRVSSLPKTLNALFAWRI